jgi:hypothetical protein
MPRRSSINRRRRRRSEPANLRNIAAFREGVVIEQEVRKGAAGNSTVVARADLLRRDVWDRWRAGQGVWTGQHATERGHRQACRRCIDWRYLTHRGKDQSCRKPL